MSGGSTQALGFRAKSLGPNGSWTLKQRTSKDFSKVLGYIITVKEIHVAGSMRLWTSVQTLGLADVGTSLGSKPQPRQSQKCTANPALLKP